MPSDLPPTDEDKQSDYVAAFVDRQGAVLAESPFTVSFEMKHQNPDLPGATLPTTAFSIVRPFPAQATSVVIRHAGKVLTSLALSANEPQLGAVKVTPSTDKADEIYVEWEGSHPDGVALTYSLSYSNDGGKTFRPIEGGVKTNAIVVSTLGLAGGKEVVLKVTASDGFYTTEAVSAPFFLANNAPVAVILSPYDKAVFSVKESIEVRGMALDVEDGLLDGEMLQWEISAANGVQPLGTGGELSLKSLPAGEYVLRLVAVDRDGAKSVAEQLIVVQEALDKEKPGVAEFKVTSVTLTVTPEKYEGPGPVTIKFEGQITVNAKGTVNYNFIRSDGATGPVFTLDFEMAGSETVSTTWTLGGVGLPTYDGWQSIQVLSPNMIESNRAHFAIRSVEK